MLKTAQHSTYKSQNSVRWIYTKYGAMLLGYIKGIVKDLSGAEKQLIKTITGYIQEYGHLPSDQLTWLHLRHYTQTQLKQARLQSNHLPIHPNTTIENNPILSILEGQESIVFSEIYYHKKSIVELSGQLDLPENEVRRLLKSSLDKIRNAHGN